MTAKKVIIAIAIILVAVGGFVAGLYLLKQNQNPNEKAAVPDGKATVMLDPATGNFNAGDIIETKIKFNTANIAVSGVAVELSYPYSGSTPEVSVSSIQINSALLSSGDWTCPTKTSKEESGKVIIDIACGNTSASGFTAATDTELAKLTLSVVRKPETNPLILTFDSAKSIISQKSNGQDILLIPTSTGSFNVGGTAPTSTLTPTVKPTGSVSVTPSSKVSTSPTATPAKLPDAGVSLPTILGVGVGSIVLFAALVLAL